MNKRKIEPYILQLIRDNSKWTVIPHTVFTYDCLKGHGLENFKLTKRKQEKNRVQIGVILFNGGALGTTTFKDIFINLGIRKVGIIGTGEKSELMRVQCPYCKTINKMFQSYQKCEKCSKKFYIHDNKF